MRLVPAYGDAGELIFNRWLTVSVLSTAQLMPPQ